MGWVEHVTVPSAVQLANKLMDNYVNQWVKHPRAPRNKK